MNTTREKKRLTTRDWEKAALQLVAEEGIDKLAVEPLARRLGVTKGSFYWHFSSRDELLYAAITHWIEEDAAEVKEISLTASPRKRLVNLFKLAGQEKASHKILAALFQKQGDDKISTFVEQITNLRIQTLSQAFEEDGLNPHDAHNRALLAYTSYVGFLQLVRKSHGIKLSPEQFEHYIDHMIQTLIPN